ALVCASGVLTFSCPFVATALISAGATTGAVLSTKALIEHELKMSKWSGDEKYLKMRDAVDSLAGAGYSNQEAQKEVEGGWFGLVTEVVMFPTLFEPFMNAARFSGRA